MLTTIFYFSGTGNSLKVARDLAGNLPQAKLLSIPAVIDQELVCAGKIGIVFPVYMFGLPLIVSRFIKKLKPGPGNYVFAVLTFGGMSGPALGQLKEEFRAQGLTLSAGFLVTMPGNYTPLYQAIAQDKQKKMFAREEERIGSIVRVINEEKIYFDTGFSLLNGLLKLVYKAGAPKIPFLDKGFWVQDSCNGCGTCSCVCPVNNIEIVKGKPRWRHRCEQCFACLQWCPKEAIQYEKNTAGRRRYHNPDVSAADIINSKNL